MVMVSQSRVDVALYIRPKFVDEDRRVVKLGSRRELEEVSLYSRSPILVREFVSRQTGKAVRILMVPLNGWLYQFVESVGE